MPKLGETVTEGTIGSWLKQVGDTVEFDDPLFEVSTDKVDSEIPSPYDGVLLEILVPAGRNRAGRHAARPDRRGRRAPARPRRHGRDAGGAPRPRRPPARRRGDARRQRRATAPAAAQPGRMLSPLVRRLAAENGLDAAAIAGTGVGGRIRREDVEKVRSPAAAPTAAPQRRPAPAPAAPAPPRHRRPAAAAPRSRPAPSDPRDEVVTLSRMRLAVAERHDGLAGAARRRCGPRSRSTSTTSSKVRRKHKDRFKKETGASLSYLPFVSRATIDALRAFPTVNSSIDIEAKTMTLHPYVNLGIAVDLDQQGLVVPVVKDADSLNMRGIAKKITELAGAARSQEAGRRRT